MVTDLFFRSSILLYSINSPFRRNLLPSLSYIIRLKGYRIVTNGLLIVNKEICSKLFNMSMTTGKWNEFSSFLISE